MQSPISSSKFNNWDAVDPLELFTANTVQKEAMPKLHIVQHLQSEGRNISYLVLWLDCDREGENICFEVIDAIKEVNRLKEDQIFRAKFSAITDVDIKKAFNTLGKPNENESLSVDARQNLDLRLGCAFTRFQTKYFQGKYGDLDSTLISYGPCQTPTLGFCVERHDVIQTFTPEPYWVIETSITAENTEIPLTYSRGRIFDQQCGHILLLLIKQHSEAVVQSVKYSTHKKQRPQAMNTVEMLRLASSGLGMGPQQTMQVAEKLYTSGYISYPRTETNTYPPNFDLKGTLATQKSNSHWGEHVRSLLSTGITSPRKGADHGDHPPITPMRSASEAELGSDGWRIFSLVTENFIASLSPDCSYEKVDVTFTIGTEEFTCTGSKVIDPGFTAVLHWQKMEDSLPPVQFVKGAKYKTREPRLTQKATTPPGYLTESELITLMEKHGIGTDASIPVHINNICVRNFVTIGSGRRLIPNTLGILLVHGYQRIDPDLVKPSMRSEIEKQFDLIATGRANYDLVLAHAVSTFQAKYKYFVENTDYMDQLFEVSFTKLSETGKSLSKCGRCTRYMKLISQKPMRLHCKNCEATYKLPQGGSIKLYQGNVCPLDQFELVVYNAGGKSFILCPYCYNFPEIEDMAQSSGCNRCPHPTCPNAAPQLSVTTCQTCDEGDLVLDPNSGLKNMQPFLG